jgi:hypothetical protein
MIKWIIILLLITQVVYGQFAMSDARLVGNMNVGTQYVMFNNDWEASGFNIEKFYSDGGIVSLSVSVIDQYAIYQGKLVKEIPYVVYKTPTEKIQFDYNMNDLVIFLKEKGYLSSEIDYIKQRTIHLFSW